MGGRVDVADMRLLFGVRGRNESDVDHSRRSIVLGRAWSTSRVGRSLTSASAVDSPAVDDVVARLHGEPPAAAGELKGAQPREEVRGDG